MMLQIDSKYICYFQVIWGLAFNETIRDAGFFFFLLPHGSVTQHSFLAGLMKGSRKFTDLGWLYTSKLVFTHSHDELCNGEASFLRWFELDIFLAQGTQLCCFFEILLCLPEDGKNDWKELCSLQTWPVLCFNENAEFIQHLFIPHKFLKGLFLLEKQI